LNFQGLLICAKFSTIAAEIGLRLYRPTVGAFGMAEYRAYTIGSDGHFAGYEAFVCEGDATAIERAKRLVAADDVEFWSGPRLVAKLPGKPK
jgi:hypothetical protein